MWMNEMDIEADRDRRPDREGERAMTAKTPAEIAREVTRNWFNAPDTDEIDLIDRIAAEAEWGGGSLHDLMVAAIEADRAQRDLIECIAEALDDRGAKDAAQLVRDTDPDDDLWNNYVGPMLDSIEDDYTRMAREIKEATA